MNFIHIPYFFKIPLNYIYPHSFGFLLLISSPSSLTLISCPSPHYDPLLHRAHGHAVVPSPLCPPLHCRRPPTHLFGSSPHPSFMLLPPFPIISSQRPLLLVLWFTKPVVSCSLLVCLPTRKQPLVFSLWTVNVLHACLLVPLHDLIPVAGCCLKKRMIGKGFNN